VFSTVSDLLFLTGILLAAGVFTGLTAGLLGVGGGIVIVPVLFHLFTSIGIHPDVRIHVAVGTSLATIIATSFSSLRAHHKRGGVDIALVRAWGPAIFIGVLIGSFLAGHVKGPVLMTVFATVGLAVALHMAFNNPAWTLATSLPSGMKKQTLAGTIGMISAMMGIGGGTLSVPVLTLFGYPIHRAVGSAAAIGLIIGIPGTLAFVATGWNVPGRPPYSLGYVNLLALVLILPTSMYFAPVGARLAYTLNTRNLRRAFAIFLAFTALRMFYSIIF
jgi:uncharacterized membrane protein YfcA